jgi:3-dehydro-L-gulonate 2-dehydrogenase
MTIGFDEVKKTLAHILLRNGFTKTRAELCAGIFAGNSRDGVHSHGLSRFPVFMDYIKKGWIDINAEPSVESSAGCIENWDGNLAPGVYTATLATDRAVALAKEHGMGLVAVKNSNHWMRGGTYGWQAADSGCIAICGTNSIANMPPFGGKQATLGNNPLVIAVPRQNGHLVLDMAMSQYSYGKLNEFKMKGSVLQVPGGYDEDGALSQDPSAIIQSQRTLPIGYWKGSGLSMMMDVLVAGLSGGRSVKDITMQGSETGVSHFFLCISPAHFDESIIDNIVEYAKSSATVDEKTSIRYPGEQTLSNRAKSEKEGIEVPEAIWQKITGG